MCYATSIIANSTRMQCSMFRDTDGARLITWRVKLNARSAELLLCERYIMYRIPEIGEEMTFR